MTIARGAVIATLVGAVALVVSDAGACSCMPPEAWLLSPQTSEPVPANAKVRVQMPEYRATPRSQLVLRVHGGANVDTKARKVDGRSLAVVELTPSAPLVADTRYEVVVIDAERHPPNHVLGTFKTGAAIASDTTSPRIDKMGAVIAEKSGQLRSSCSVPGPWIVASDMAASDPGRPNAQLVWGVWLGDNAGNVDATKPPTRIIRPDGPLLFIGQGSACDFRDFPIPSTPSVWLGIAAIDEAGNQSALKKVKVDLAGAKIK